MNVSIKQATKEAAQHLQAHVDVAQLEAELLLAFVLQKSRTWLIAFSETRLSSTELHAYQALMQQRQQGKPIAHLTGERDFWTLTLTITPDTLIPRPETELLVETALQLSIENNPVRILDLGTGSGAIALALAHERPAWEIIATDQSTTALDIARHNADKHNITNVSFIESDWFQALSNQSPFDIIISNPPYIPVNDRHLVEGDVRFEPLTALASGEDGLQDIRQIVAKAADHLKPRGYLLLEHGYDQGNAVRNLMTNVGFVDTRSLNDLARLERVTLGSSGA